MRNHLVCACILLCLMTTGTNGANAAPNVLVTGYGRTFFGGSLKQTGRDFGPRLLGSVTTTALTIHNTGDANLNLTATVQATSVPGPAFSITNQPGSVIAPGTSSTFILQFSPQQLGSHTGSVVRVFTNDPDTPTTQFAVNGTGIVGPIPPQTDLEVAFLGEPIAICKDGECRIKGKLLVTNFGDLGSTESTCFLRFGVPALPPGILPVGTPIFFKGLGKIAAPKPGKPFKFRKVRFTSEIPSTPFQLFAVADPSADDVNAEADFANNLAVINVTP